MSMNDPFGRMSKRHEREFHSLKGSLQKAGITTPEQAETVRKSLDKRARSFAVVDIMATGILLIAMPHYWGLFLALGAVMLMWVINVTRRGKVCIDRYIHEMKQSADAQPSDAHKQHTTHESDLDA